MSTTATADVVIISGTPTPTSPSRRIPLDVLLVVAVGFAAAVYPVFVRGGSMTSYGYDGSVYFGASVRLVHGVLPYRDFVFPQPPGIVLLMAPVSLASIVLGTNAGLWLARLATILVVTANCGLVAVLLRRFGMAASLTGGLYLALFSAAYAADSQLKLEPYLVFFCLLGALLLFEGSGVAGGRRALWAGVALGIAGLVKLPAILPAIVMMLLVARYRRGALGRFIAGAALALGIGSVPFFLAAPSAFMREVFVLQALPQKGAAGTSTGLLGRAEYLAYADFRTIAGMLPSGGEATSVWIAVVVLALAALAVVLRRASMTALEWFGIGAFALVTPALLVSPHSFTYYLYFQAPFLALTVGPMVAYGLYRLRSPAARRRRPLDRAIAAAAAACLLVGSVLAWRDQASFSEEFAAYIALPSPVGWVSPLIPSGSCVVTDDAYLTLVTNRFSPSTSGCPAQVEADATWASAYPSDLPPTKSSVPALTDEWQQMLSASDYFVLDDWTEEFVPWTPELRSWFNQNFRLLATQGGVSVYRNEFVTPL